MRSIAITSALVLTLAVIMVPLAFSQLHSAGLAVLSAAALTVIAAIGISSFSTIYFATRNPVAGLLIAMTARMLLPLVFVVTILLWNSPAAPAWSAMYVAPLYFVMLIAETASAVRQCRSIQLGRSGWMKPLPQLATNEGM